MNIFGTQSHEGGWFRWFPFSNRWFSSSKCYFSLGFFHLWITDCLSDPWIQKSSGAVCPNKISFDIWHPTILFLSKAFRNIWTKTRWIKHLLRIPTDGDLEKKHHVMFSFARKLFNIIVQIFRKPKTWTAELLFGVPRWSKLGPTRQEHVTWRGVLWKGWNRCVLSLTKRMDTVQYDHPINILQWYERLQSKAAHVLKSWVET